MIIVRTVPHMPTDSSTGSCSVTQTVTRIPTDSSTGPDSVTQTVTSIATDSSAGPGSVTRTYELVNMLVQQCGELLSARAIQDFPPNRVRREHLFPPSSSLQAAYPRRGLDHILTAHWIGPTARSHATRSEILGPLAFLSTLAISNLGFRV